MIVCPTCDYQNPVGAVKCEACLSTLPNTITCPKCKTSVQGNAIFCGQCGYDLRQKISNPKITQSTLIQDIEENAQDEIKIPEITPESSQDNVEETPDIVVSAIKANLLHVQTNTLIELPPELHQIRLGKPNDRCPPDIDLSGFPDSQFVSRVHAQINREGHFFYIEDLGSANGTYVNHVSLIKGKPHPLTSGARIALGREDRVSFIFQTH